MTTTSNLKTVDATTLKRWLEQERVTLVDVREPGEYREERIESAHLVPLSNFNPAHIPPREDKKLVLYCRSGNRSSQAAAKLLAHGYEEVTHLQNGLSASIPSPN
jgi:rhodanese-related sulfurtransferase